MNETSGATDNPGFDEAPGPEGLLVTSPSLLLVGLGRQARGLLDVELARLGLSLRYLGVLGHLKHDPELSISDLARRAGVTAQSMHATVRNLESRGLVEAAPGGRGRRSRVTVTPRGFDLLERARQAAVVVDDVLLGHLDQAQREALTATLQALASGLVSADTSHQQPLLPRPL